METIVSLPFGGPLIFKVGLCRAAAGGQNFENPGVLLNSLSRGNLLFLILGVGSLIFPSTLGGKALLGGMLREREQQLLCKQGSVARPCFVALPLHDYVNQLRTCDGGRLSVSSYISMGKLETVTRSFFRLGCCLLRCVWGDWWYLLPLRRRSLQVGNRWTESVRSRA